VSTDPAVTPDALVLPPTEPILIPVPFPAE